MKLNPGSGCGCCTGCLAIIMSGSCSQTLYLPDSLIEVLSYPSQSTLIASGVTDQNGLFAAAIPSNGFYYVRCTPQSSRFVQNTQLLLLQCGGSYVIPAKLAPGYACIGNNDCALPVSTTLHWNDGGIYGPATLVYGTPPDSNLLQWYTIVTRTVPDCLYPVLIGGATVPSGPTRMKIAIRQPMTAFSPNCAITYPGNTSFLGCPGNYDYMAGPPAARYCLDYDSVTINSCPPSFMATGIINACTGASIGYGKCSLYPDGAVITVTE